jgi:hypothetical protein
MEHPWLAKMRVVQKEQGLDPSWESAACEGKVVPMDVSSEKDWELGWETEPHVALELLEATLLELKVWALIAG